jgi:hypothetical protein
LKQLSTVVRQNNINHMQEPNTLRMLQVTQKFAALASAKGRPLLVVYMAVKFHTSSKNHKQDLCWWGTEHLAVRLRITWFVIVYRDLAGQTLFFWPRGNVMRAPCWEACGRPVAAVHRGCLFLSITINNLVHRSPSIGCWPAATPSVYARSLFPPLTPSANVRYS